jgi:predicted metalloendopeptidase
MTNVDTSMSPCTKRQLAFIGHPLDRTQWLMTPPTLNAYEDPQTNTINFPAGILPEYTGPVPGIAGVEQDGKLTQGEDTADNGGLYLALSALVDDLKQQGKTLDTRMPMV